MDDATPCLVGSRHAQRMRLERIQPQRIMLTMPFDRAQWQEADRKRGLGGAKLGGQHQFPLHMAFGEWHHLFARF
jgi:hypothetical protein